MEGHVQRSVDMPPTHLFARKAVLLAVSLLSVALLIWLIYTTEKESIQYENIALVQSKDSIRHIFEKGSTQYENTAFVQNKDGTGNYGAYTPNRNSKRDSLIPTIVMAASSNHFLESQALLQNIDTVLYPKYGKLKIIYFDLGLTAKERQILETFCHCEVRIFPFEKYSSHVKKSLNACTWKPKIILEMMKEFKFVMYVDTSIRFKKTEKLFDDLLIKTTNPRTPVLVIKGFPNLMERTYLYTFQSLNEDPWKYNKLPEVGAGWIFARWTPFAEEKIIGPWADCGLKYGCMGKGESAGFCPRPKKPTVGVCHRFDQSVIGIIMNKVYNGNYDIFSFNISRYMDIKRGHTVQYLPKTIHKIK